MTRRDFISQTALTTAQPGPGTPSSVVLSDFQRCRPAAALSAKPKHNRWRLLPYDSDAGGGTMLVAGHNTLAPEIQYPLTQSGWFAIHLGLRSDGEPTQVLARLAGDAAFVRIVHRPSRGGRIDEVFWKTARLSPGDVIVFRQSIVQTVPESATSVGNRCDPAWIAYIKLVPVSGDQAGETPEKRLFAHHDAWSYTYSYRPTTEEEIRRELEPFRGSDFQRVYWEAGSGDQAFFFSRIAGSSFRPRVTDFYRVGDRLSNESFGILQKRGIDPLRVALQHAHEMGLEFHAAYRPAGFHYPPPHYEEWTTGGLYDRHPEWRCITREGKPSPRLSYAYPEVRRWVIDFLREVAQFPIDGVAILYNRRPPLVEYEPPVVESFRKRYGQDPRSLEERDPRWLRHRAGVLTAFMRELRAAMGPRPVTAFVMGTEESNLYHALDLPAWIEQRLVDVIVPYDSGPGNDSFADPRQADWFLRITRGTRCKLALNLMPRLIEPDEYRRRAHQLYQAGVEHLAFWDTNTRCRFDASWDVLRRLGHRAELADWVRRGSPSLERQSARLTRLGDWDLRYATPG